MNNDFKWDDATVIEFVTWTLNGSPTFQSRYADIEQFKESKQPKPEYIIFSFKNKSTGHIDDIDSKRASLNINWWLNDSDNWAINSVKRLSDGSVFTLGDICFYEINGLDYYRRDFTITKFDIDRNEIRVWGEEIYNPMCELSSLKKQIVTADFKVEFNLQVTAPPQELTINGVKYKPSK